MPDVKIVEKIEQPLQKQGEIPELTDFAIEGRIHFMASPTQAAEKLKQLTHLFMDDPDIQVQGDTRMDLLKQQKASGIIKPKNEIIKLN